MRKGIGTVVRKGIFLAFLIIAAALMYKPVLRAYHGYTAGDQGQEQLEVLDIDKLCRKYVSMLVCQAIVPVQPIPKLLQT